MKESAVTMGWITQATSSNDGLTQGRYSRGDSCGGEGRGPTSRRFYPHLTRQSLLFTQAFCTIACGHVGTPAVETDAASADVQLDGNNDARPSSDVQGTDLSTDDVDDASTFHPAPHVSLPLIPNHGGPILGHPQLIIVTYSDDPLATHHESVTRFLAASEWLQTVGRDYGVGTASVLGSVRLSTPAPRAVTDSQIQAFLDEGILAGLLPSPMMNDFSNTLYMVFFPPTTSITWHGMTSCHPFRGYHGNTFGPRSTAYAVLPDCGEYLRPQHPGEDLPESQAMEVVTSHEMIEAATDPFGGAYETLYTDFNLSAWNSAFGGEVGDLCEGGNRLSMEGGYLFQRIWSNSAASRGRDPCVPVASSVPYFNVSPATYLVSGAPGETVSLAVTGWSTARVADWPLLASAYPETIRVALDRSVINNGQMAVLRVTFPSEAIGADANVLLVSGTYPRSAWPISIHMTPLP